MLQEGMLRFALLGAGWVLWLLVGLSLAVFAISLERLVALLRDSTDLAKLGAALNKFFEDGDAPALKTRLHGINGVESRILASGAEIAHFGPEAVEEAISGQIIAERMKMERGLAVLATVGSNGPFVGLFGTVLGIIAAIRDLSVSDSQAIDHVMSNIAEALVATAVGLMVAIPAVVLYNAFNRWVRARISRSESLSRQMIARLRGNPHAAAAAK